MNVTMVIVGEDCALPSTGGSAGRRGLCGTVLVHKVRPAVTDRIIGLPVVPKRTSAANGTTNVHVCIERSI